mmetsp:Transcript_70513/g.187832  ORF Transcript_70513/g.187832 Transcript_70513/m.187832 type:complete len:202 (-) Transcript_70513:706-1311(-)
MITKQKICRLPESGRNLAHVACLPAVLTLRLKTKLVRKHRGVALQHSLSLPELRAAVADVRLQGEERIGNRRGQLGGAWHWVVVKHTVAEVLRDLGLVLSGITEPAAQRVQRRAKRRRRQRVHGVRAHNHGTPVEQHRQVRRVARQPEPVRDGPKRTEILGRDEEVRWELAEAGQRCRVGRGEKPGHTLLILGGVHVPDPR